jgi:DNA helicase-2/ATP-dependent DNA helicase PcrA
MEKKYNQAQLGAIMHSKGPALVVAGAGTGKTAVIAARILELIHKSVSPENILALTFTDKAAAQMQDRIDTASPIGYIDSTITTFHSFCADILRRYGVEIGLNTNFQIISTYQQIIILQDVVNSSKLSYHKPASNPYGLVHSLLGFFSHLKDEAISPGHFKKFVRQQASATDKQEQSRLGELSLIYAKFEDAYKVHNALDYGDLLVKTLELFQNRPAVLKYFQQQYSHILVDEFQDTNFVQNEIVNLLAKDHQNLFVVGDDDQSIYRFRGAAISNILHFLQDYPNAKQFVLTQNYRSTQSILDSSYSLIQKNNPYRLEDQNKINKKLKGTGKGRPPQYHFADSLPAEANLVAQKISEYIKKGKDANTIAILLRKNNQAEAFTYALDKLGIPYELGQNKKLFEQPLIRAIINLIKVVNDPNDSQALYIVLASQLYNVPIYSVIEASAAANRARVGLEQYLRSEDIDNSDFLKALDDIISLRTQSAELPAGQILYGYLEESSILRRLVAKSDTDIEAVLELQYLSQLFGLIKDYERSSLENNMHGLYMYLELMHQSEVDITAEVSPLDQNAVKILTVHKAKGLEFEVVFIIDMVEQTFPANKRSEPIRVPSGLFETDDDAINWHLLEERRLFYVAMTRAKTELIITASADHGGKRAKKPSRFIAEALGVAATNNTTTKAVRKSDVLSNLVTARMKKIPNFDPKSKYFDEQGWLHLSVNQVADYLRSPKEFWYFDVLNLPKGPFHSLIYGSAIHGAIEQYYTARLHNQKISLSDVIASFESTWRSEGFVSVEHEQDRLQRGKAVLTQFYKANQKLNDLPAWVEKPFTLRLEEVKLIIRGRYDAVFDRDGSIEIQDFKTGDIADASAAQKRLKDSVQMGIYALAWERIHGSLPDMVSLNFLENNIVAKQAPTDTVKVMKQLKKVREGILAGEFSSPGQSRINFERFM